MEWWNVGAGLTSPRGQYIVMPTASARTAAWNLCENRRREYQLLRRHAFKLVYWPTGAEEGGQPASDIDWDWIKSLEGKRVGELRIDEHINGHNNVRVIFFKANKPLPGEALCRIWLLTVFQKKRQQFTNTEIRVFKSMRDLIVIRHYGGDSQA